jgi:subtilisin family serine protease
LLVAAAGNDSCNDRARLGPRLPAALDGALAVSAFVRDARNGSAMQIADYSNDDDCLPHNDGIGAFGGNVRQAVLAHGAAAAAGGQVQQYAETDRAQELVGLYVGDAYPADRPHSAPAENTTGWAGWAGTSFATPVAAGFAACLWSENPDLTARGVRDSIVYNPDGTERELEYLPLIQQ